MNEALPQSILQLVAMVFYKETNLISICSIILSMTSIMIKSFVISTGVEWKSYLLTWLCVITDFFSIFFIVSWIFLSNDDINGNFLGYFSILGEIWIFKVGMSIALPCIAGAVVYCIIGWPFVAYFFWSCYSDNNDDCMCIAQFLFVLLWLIFGNTLIFSLYCILSIIIGLLFEILCFSHIALFVYKILTDDRWFYEHKDMAKQISEMINFISNASNTRSVKNDRIMRIICINYGFFKTYGPPSRLKKLSQIIENGKKDEALNTLTYKQLRTYSQDHDLTKKVTNPFHAFTRFYKDTTEEVIDKYKTVDCSMTWGFNSFVEDMFWCVFGSCGILVLYISVPIYILSRLCTVLYPYYLIYYIYDNNLWFKLDLFELSMLGIYVVLQNMTFIAGIFAFRTHYWLWHIVPGESYFLEKKKVDIFFHKTYKYYDEIQWLPFVKEIILNQFGKDIGSIIVDYLESLTIDDNDESNGNNTPLKPPSVHVVIETQ